jgi:tetratricopeptide (TPR) repeat protein
VHNLLIGLLGALVAANEPAALTNQPTASTRISIPAPDPNDPLEKQLAKLMADDNASQAEVDQWIKDNDAFAAKGGGVPKAEMRHRILERFASVRKGYEDLILAHPDYAKARVAYASFLGDINDEEGARDQLEKAMALDGKDPAALNNLANIYAHIGPIEKAFECYAKAIELKPLESLYYHNLGNVVFLFRKDAMEIYHINEQQVFDKALDLLQHALRLDPDNFPLATEVAQTYYGVTPARTDDALRAWTNAMSLAHDPLEREGTEIHMARVKTMAGRFAEAHGHLDAVTLPDYDDLKRRVTRTLASKEFPTPATNGTPAVPADSATNRANGTTKH